VVEKGRLDVAFGGRGVSGRICELGNHERLQVWAAGGRLHGGRNKSYTRCVLDRNAAQAAKRRITSASTKDNKARDKKSRHANVTRRERDIHATGK
jgi:hypothetical protein